MCSDDMTESGLELQGLLIEKLHQQRSSSRDDSDDRLCGARSGKAEEMSRETEDATLTSGCTPKWGHQVFQILKLDYCNRLRDRYII
jgi:hypothetical protein